MKKTLFLTLKKEWFDKIKSGEKKEEYRDPSMWILSRLQTLDADGKSLVPIHYDTVTFQNGYRKESPKIVVEYKGYYFRDDGIVVIRLGKVIGI